MKNTKKITHGNLGKVGQKSHFTPKQFQMIFDHLNEWKDKNGKDLRDLALFTTAVDTMLRASDLLCLKVDDVQNDDYSMKAEVTLRQEKTEKVHTVEISETTQGILSEWIETSHKWGDDYLFTRAKRRKGFQDEPISYEQYRAIVKGWAKIARVKNLDRYSTHSLRRTQAVEVWLRTHNAKMVMELLGQSSLSATGFYLGLDKKEALKQARQHRLLR